MLGKRKNEHKICIFYPFPHFDSVPNLINFVNKCSNKDINVDIISEFDLNHIKPISQKNIKYYLNRELFFKGLSQKILSTLKLKNSKKFTRYFGIYNNIIHHIIQNLFVLVIKIDNSFFNLYIDRLIANNNYLCIIGVEPKGLHLAYEKAKNHQIPLIYYSLELFLSYEVSGDDLILKRDEIEESKKSDMIITQDRIRAGLIIKDNKLDNINISIIHSGPMGQGNFVRTNYWENVFNLERGSKIILHTGTISHWSGLEVIFESVNFWDSNYYLVLHSRSKINLNTITWRKRFDAFSDKQKQQIKFSFDPVQSENYDKLIQGADIGLTLYIPREFDDFSKSSRYEKDNLKYLGFASGKIGFFLKYGKPIIINSAPNFSECVQKLKIGVIANDPLGIKNGIDVITSDYLLFSHNAIDFFNHHYNPEPGIESTIENILNLYQN